MNAVRLTFALVIAALSVAVIAEESIEQQLSITSLDAYLASANSELLDGGELSCDTLSGIELHSYNSCEAFSALHEQGCYGRTTSDIGWELRHEATCAKMEALTVAKDSPTHHFNLGLTNWWVALPAEVIPMSGGIYSDESWAISKRQRDAVVIGKDLSEISLLDVSSEPGHFEATIEVLVDKCGETRNRIVFDATLLADFDNDGIAELLIEGNRQYESDTCRLGTGSSVGATFSAVLKKTGPDSQIILISIPGIN